MQGVLLILVMAIIVEALVEYGKTIVTGFARGRWRTAVTQLISIVVGVGLCLAAEADLFATMEIHFRYGWLGVVLTGVIISRGSNYVSDFAGKLQRKGDMDNGQKNLSVGSGARKG